MSAASVESLQQQLLESLTTEFASANPLDDATASCSLSSIISSLSSPTLSLLDSCELDADSAARLRVQLSCIPTACYLSVASTIASISACLSSSPSLPSSSAASSWTWLNQQGLGTRALVSLLSWQLRLQGLSRRTLVLGSVYLRLLSLPEPPHHAWSEMLMRRLLSLLCLWATRKQEQNFQQFNSERSQRQRKRRGRAVKPDVQDGEENDDDRDDEEKAEMALEEEDASVLSSAEGEELVAALLSSMRAAFSSFSLQQHADIRPALIDALIAITRTQQQGDSSSASPAALSWSVLQLLCLPLHGDPQSAFQLELKALLPNSLMSFLHLTAASPPRPLLLIHQSTAAFLLSPSSCTAQYPQCLHRYLQHLCVSVPDRAEWRRVLVRHIVDLLLPSASAILAPFSLFVSRLSRNAKPALRTVAVELAALLLASLSATVAAVEMTTLTSLLLARCSDRSSGVRAKALTEVAAVLEAGEKDTALLQLLLTAVEGAAEEEEEEAEAEQSGSVILSTPSQRQSHLALATPLELYTPATSASFASSLHSVSIPVSPAAVASLPARSLLRLLHRRAADARPAVRRAAISGLQQLLTARLSLPALLPGVSSADLQLLYDGCSDSSSMVRKAALGSLSSVLRCYDSDEVMQRVWAGAVLPLVEDAEASVKEKAVSSAQEMIVDRCLVALQGRQQAGQSAAAVWKVLSCLDSTMLRFLHVAIACMLKARTSASHCADTLAVHGRGCTGR